MADTKANKHIKRPKARMNRYQRHWWHQHKIDRRVYRSLPYVLVIQAHFFHLRADGTVSINRGKTYNWRVDRNTRHIRNVRVGGVASVKNNNPHAKYHKSRVLITNIVHAKGTMARRMALQLDYVINFYNKYLDPKTHKIVWKNRHRE